MNYFAILGHNGAASKFMFKLYGVDRYDPENPHDLLTEGSETLTHIPVEPILGCSLVADSTGEEGWCIPTSISSELTYADDGGDSIYEVTGGSLSHGSLIVDIPDSGTDVVGAGKYFMIRFKPIDSDKEKFSSSLLIGSFSWGMKYDMLHSPDLTYSMGVSHDGVKTIKSAGGSSLTNVSYARKPMFLGYLDGFGKEWDSGFSGTGRLNWKMNFSQLRSDYPTNYHDNTLFPRGAASNTEFRYGNNFYFRVLAMTLGGQLPFIFEYDNSVNTTGSPIGQWADGEHNENHFAIAKFKKNSIQFKHKSHKFFDVSLDIEETW